MLNFVWMFSLLFPSIAYSLQSVYNITYAEQYENCSVSAVRLAIFGLLKGSFAQGTGYQRRWHAI